MRSIARTSDGRANRGTVVHVKRPWLILCVILGTAPALRFGDVQGVELAQVLFLCLAAPLFVYHRMRIPTSGLWGRYGKWYVWFLCLSAGVSVLSLRLRFYPPPDISWLKWPMFLSISRIFELSLAIYFMIALAEAFRRRPALLRLALDVYSWVGTLSACLSIASWVLLKTAGISTLLVYGPDSRVRGFFNEGGPYGMFLVSVVLVVLMRSQLSPFLYSFTPSLVVSLLLTALWLSGSKVGFLAAVSLCGIGATVSRNRRQRVVLIGVCALTLIGFFTLFEGKLFGYAYAYLNLDESLYFRPDDPSLIMGRLAAAVIVPRMIAAHPLAGIGVGNYSLMRNDPEYLQGLPPVDEWDLAGMGLLGSTAEFGIPLTLFLLALVTRPFVRAMRHERRAIVAVAAAFQPLAFLLGVNLNFFYPWLLAAFALSLESALGSRPGGVEN